ncbi:MAG: OmpA family protein [Deltaproteobacteria bacterium]|nr:OmpA family protein [Deltaproteobacteria bacterium]
MKSFRTVSSRLALCLGLLGLPLGCTGPDYPTCENDDHCRRDGRREWCVQGRCQQCRSNGDCGPERTCLRNRCVAGANACEGDNDCLVNQRCDVNSHTCVARAECDDNRPCPVGRHCDLGRCLEDAAPPTDPVDNRGPQCNLDAPLFAYDDNQLDEFARQSLQRWAECLQRERTSRYVLIGRCDARGGAEYNLALGERRARAVQRYLIGLGVLPDRLAVSSEGAEGAVGTDEDGYRRDRRVDFRVRQ